MLSIICIEIKSIVCDTHFEIKFTIAFHYIIIVTRLNPSFCT